MNILGIETSCDETGIAIVKDGKTILANVVNSQIKAHKKYGGVVPELASRMHTECIHALINRAFKDAQLSPQDIDAIAVTQGPGLEGALLIGQAVAKTMSVILDIPLVPVNHMHGHIYASFIDQDPPKFPFICLIASGGHTMLVRVNDHFMFEILGQTRDDAAGEAFDKVARALGLSYPGGPQIEEYAKTGKPTITFPLAMIKEGLEFSFSGLKTAVIQEINKQKKETADINTHDIAASFQETIIQTLKIKSLRACKKHHINTLVISGGVSANQPLRDALQNACKNDNIRCIFPPMSLSTDNGAMIAIAAYHAHKTLHLNDKKCRVKPNLAV